MQTLWQDLRYGYTLLGAVSKGAAEMTFTDYLHARVCKPAGMPAYAAFT